MLAKAPMWTHGRVACADLENVIGAPISSVISCGQFVAPWLVERGQLADGGDPFGRVEAGPGALVERLPGGGHRAVHVRGSGSGYPSDDVFAVRRHDFDRALLARRDPLASDEQTFLLLHEYLRPQRAVVVIRRAMRSGSTGGEIGSRPVDPGEGSRRAAARELRRSRGGRRVREVLTTARLRRRC